MPEAAPVRADAPERGDAPAEKLVTFAVPCYNSADYMDRCVQSILDGCAGRDDVEVVIVDDGSQRDATPAKADEWARRLPQTVVAVHQENGGHGAAVLAGLAHARGRYYKVVDSDDWLDAQALRTLLSDMDRLLAAGEVVDLFVTNYVYEHVADGTTSPIGYHGVLPEGRVFSWDEMGRFRIDQNLLMHSLTYRTEVLRSQGVPLPRHTFYVDNIYAYVPLPRCRKVFYRDADLYRYYIGREDQSVNEQVMTSRYDQQLRITRIMCDAYHLFDDVASEPLRRYMLGYFTMMMVISSVFSKLSPDPDADDNLAKLWAHVKAYDPRMYAKARHGLLGVATNLPGGLGKRATIGLYRIARKVVKFN